MKPTRLLATLGAALFPVVLFAVAATGCKKEETEPPPPAPAPAPTPTPVTTVVPEEDAGIEDAGSDAGDAGPPKASGPGPVQKCCNALKQNQKSAPPDQQAAYATAIGVCNGLAASGQGQQALSVVRAALRGANMPDGCK